MVRLRARTLGPSHPATLTASDQHRGWVLVAACTLALRTVTAAADHLLSPAEPVPPPPDPDRMAVPELVIELEIRPDGTRCRDGGDGHHARALRRSLDGPPTILGCSGTVPSEHRTVLFPGVLDGLGAMAGTPVTADDVREAMDEALARARGERPQMDWSRWTTSVVRP